MALVAAPKESPSPPDARDLAALVQRAADGDVAAFERLIAHYQPRVFNFALSFTADRDAASDLAQEALIKVYRSIGSFRFESAFSTWLFRIVKNAFLDEVKSRQHRERLLEGSFDQVGDDHPELQQHALADERLVRQETRRELGRALQRVPATYRMVVALFDLQGFSYDEIAELMEIPVGTVKSRLKRGRDALRAEIFRGVTKKPTEESTS